MSILYICGGCPGAGKTHYINSILEEDSQVRVSIEDIRMELVPENQQLYSKETLVFNTFLERIMKALEDDYDVYADATNLTKQEIREKGLTEYFKVILYSEDVFGPSETIGRFETLKEAHFEARRFSDEQIDGEDWRVDIYKYWYDDVHTKYKWDEDSEYDF